MNFPFSPQRSDAFQNGLGNSRGMAPRRSGDASGFTNENYNSNRSQASLETSGRNVENSSTMQQQRQEPQPQQQTTSHSSNQQQQQQNNNASSNQQQQLYTSLLNHLFESEDINASQVPSPIYKKLLHRMRRLIYLNIHREKKRIQKLKSTTTGAHLKSSSADNVTSEEIIWIVNEIRLQWKDIFQDLRQWQQQQEKQKEGNAAPNVNASQGEQDQLTDQTSQQLTETFNLIKHEIQQTILSQFDTFSIEEFRNLLNSLLAYISHKEQQYRRIPRKILERYIERFIPNIDTTTTGTGASFVSFIVQQLKRMKMASDKKMDLDLFGRLISAIIRELMGRYVVPVPMFHFLDDKSREQDVPKEDEESSTQKDTEKDDTATLSRKTFINDQDMHRAIVSFDRNFQHYRLADALRTSEEKVDTLVAYSQDVANLIHLRRAHEESLSQSAGNQSLISIRPMAELDSGNTIQRSSLYTSRYSSMTHGGVGPLEFHLPLHKDPQKKLQEIEQEKKCMLRRLEALEKMTLVWNSLTEKQKSSTCQQIRERLHAIHHAYKLHRMLRHLSQKQLNDQDLLQVYEESYTSQVVQQANRFHQPVNRYKTLVEESQKRQFPKFLHLYLNLTQKDVETLQNVDIMYKLAFQNGWLSTLRERYKELNQISLGSFKERLRSVHSRGSDPLLRESALYHLMALIREKEGSEASSLNGQPQDHFSNDKVLSTLHTWIRYGYPNESRFKALNTLLKTTVQYVSEDSEIRFNQVEEFFLREKLKQRRKGNVKNNRPTAGDELTNLMLEDEDTHNVEATLPGIQFGLEFINSLRDMFQESHINKQESFHPSPEEAYANSTEKQLESLAFQEIDEFLEREFDMERPSRDEEEKLHKLFSREPQEFSRSSTASVWWKSLVSKSRKPASHRKQLLHYLQQQLMREEEEKQHLLHDLNAASRAIPNRGIIASDLDTWVQQLQEGWSNRDGNNKGGLLSSRR